MISALVVKKPQNYHQTIPEVNISKIQNNSKLLHVSLAFICKRMNVIGAFGFQ